MISADFWFIFVSLILYIFFLKFIILDIKLKCFLDAKLGGDAAGREESRDLLNVAGDKNDYDWRVFFVSFLTSCCCI